MSGIAEVTVTVEDGGLDGNLDTPEDNAVFSRTIEVSVNPANDPPTLDPLTSPRNIDEGAGLQTISLSGISAGGEDSQPLRVTAASQNVALIAETTVAYESPATTV